jgi:hypothetical protein
MVWVMESLLLAGSSSTSIEDLDHLSSLLQVGNSSCCCRYLCSANIMLLWALVRMQQDQHRGPGRAQQPAAAAPSLYVCLSIHSLHGGFCQSIHGLGSGPGGRSGRRCSFLDLDKPNSMLCRCVATAYVLHILATEGRQVAEQRQVHLA